MQPELTLYFASGNRKRVKLRSFTKISGFLSYCQYKGYVKKATLSVWSPKTKNFGENVNVTFTYEVKYVNIFGDYFYTITKLCGMI